MPKHDTALTKPRTQPGQSYLIPEGRVISFGVDKDGSNPIIVLAIDPLEAAMMERAAREVVKMTFPRTKADVVLPIGEKDDAPCLYASGQFPTVLRDAANQTLESVEAGTLVRFRVMLKAYRIEGRIEVCVFPSRLDVLPVSPALPGPMMEKPVQLAMPLEPPAKPAAKSIKAKAPPKPKKPPAPPRMKRKAPETAPALPSNVIPFPVKF